MIGEKCGSVNADEKTYFSISRKMQKADNLKRELYTYDVF